MAAKENVVRQQKAVLLAQQRLAATKAALAQYQKIASLKEAQAAEFLRSATHAAAVDFQRSEAEAAKLSALQRNGALHTVAKEAHRFAGLGLSGPWGVPPNPPSGLLNPIPSTKNPLVWG